MTISPAPVPNQFRTSAGEVLKLTEFDIGVWNLTTTPSKSVDITPILNINVRGVMLRFINDSQTGFYFNPQQVAAGVTKMVQIYTSTSVESLIILGIPSLWTGTEWDGSTVSRGKLYLWHIL